MILTLEYRNCILGYSFLSLLLIFISNIVSTRAAGSPPVIYQGNHHVFEGSPFTIVCEASVFDAIKWQKDGYTIKFDHVSTVNGVKVIIDSDKNYTMYKKEANGRILFHLNVTHARAFHSGTYRCSTFHNNSHSLTVLSGPQLQPVYDFENYKVMDWRQLKLVLKCTNSTTAKLEWRKEDKVIKESEKYKLEPTSLVIDRPTDAETGNYTCTDLASNTSVPFNVISRPFARLPDNTIVIEGESLTLECQTGGVPTPTIKWKIGNEIINGSTDRIILKPKGDVADAILYIKEVTMDDRNNYYCIASNIGNYNNMTRAGTAKSMVRVKDKLAALWPFLGICAEVFVLCAIILIYEKKRNKAELEESDTDNSPEQKNTPDHGKDSIRHRK